MNLPISKDELLDLLSEAAVEIANLDGPANIVCRRLRALQKRLEPLTMTTGELAARADVPARDLLEAAIAAGVEEFWHAGQPIKSPAALRTYLAMRSFADPAPEVEFDLTREEARLLAEQLDLEVEQIVPPAETASGPGRKFMPSQSQLPAASVARRKA